MKAELAQLIALQQADNRIKQLTADLKAIPQRRAEIEKEFDLRASEIRELETRRDEAQSERSLLNLEIEENKTQAARAERNLMASKKTDDYTAAIREADTARKNLFVNSITCHSFAHLADACEQFFSLAHMAF